MRRGGTFPPCGGQYSARDVVNYGWGYIDRGRTSPFAVSPTQLCLLVTAMSGGRGSFLAPFPPRLSPDLEHYKDRVSSRRRQRGEGLRTDCGRTRRDCGALWLDRDRSIAIALCPRPHNPIETSTHQSSLGLRTALFIRQTLATSCRWDEPCAP